MSGTSYRMAHAAERMLGVSQHLSADERMGAAWAVVLASVLEMPEGRRATALVALQLEVADAGHRIAEMSALAGPARGHA